ncbi:hypothetical protein [Nannocystis sp.]|uniref:nSTAND1 domain-containing NTPase n=1 Tax=Nannocystis sp. TaxID=1962667 RepID=UPI0025D46229|nr:hypothetical protein [Nannocystis sp.]MBK7826778.1 hypothetical protein [Nannocystis sp.]
MTDPRPLGPRPLGPRPAGPYVGLRPYDESERALFFGRQPEGKLVRNTILATSLAVMVAPSGAGKSSLLRTLIVPALRELGALPVYVDSWAGSPLASIQAALVASLGAGASDLPAAARLAAASHAQGLVLVLDQFEQVFIRHAAELDALGAALGSLLRNDTAVRVVLSLREEYLASLEALRPHFLTIPQAVYRLGPLAGKQAEEAIREPARLPEFHGEVEPGLVEALLLDLRGDVVASGLKTDTSQPAGISLPFLQIVLRRLWAAVAGDAAPRLTLALYRQLGGCDGIVATFVTDATRELTGQLRQDTARVLGLLAPRIGVRMAYPVDVLASQLGLPRPRIDAVLDHLDRERIVHRRDRGEVVELFHDAFTRVLRPFVEEELGRVAAAARRKQRRRVRAVIAAIVLSVIAVPIAMLSVLISRDAAEEATQLELVRSASGCDELNSATRSLWTWALELEGRGRFASIRRLRGQTTAGLLAGLRRGLVWRAVLGPRDPCDPTQAPAKPAALTIVHRGDDSDSPAIVALWRNLAGKHWREHHLPVPLAVLARRDASLADHELKLEIDGGALSVRLTLPSGPPRPGLAVFHDPAAEAPATADPDRERRPAAEAPATADPDRERPSLPWKLLRESGFLTGSLTGFLTGDDPTASHPGRAAAWSAPLWRLLARQHPELATYPASAAAIATTAFARVAADPSLYVTPDFVEAMLARVDRRAQCQASEAALRWSPSCRDDAACRPHVRELLAGRLREAFILAARDGLRGERWPAAVDWLLALEVPPVDRGRQRDFLASELAARLAEDAPTPTRPDPDLPANDHCDDPPPPGHDEIVDMLFAGIPTPRPFGDLSASELLAAIHHPPGLERWLAQPVVARDLPALVRALWWRSEQPERARDQLPWLLHSLPFWHVYCAAANDPQACTATGLLDLLRADPAGPRPTVSWTDQGIDALVHDDPDEATAIFLAAAKRGDLRPDFIANYAAPDTVDQLLRARLDHVCFGDPRRFRGEHPERLDDLSRHFSRTMLDRLADHIPPDGFDRVCKDLLDLGREPATILGTLADPGRDARTGLMLGTNLLRAALESNQFPGYRAQIRGLLNGERGPASAGAGRSAAAAAPDDLSIGAWDTAYDRALDICNEFDSRSCTQLMLDLAMDRLPDAALMALADEVARQRIGGPPELLETLLKNLLKPGAFETFTRTCALPLAQLKDKAPSASRLALSWALQQPRDVRRSCLRALRTQLKAPGLAGISASQRRVLTADAERMLGCYDEAGAALGPDSDRTSYDLTLRAFLALRVDLIEAARIADGPLRVVRGQGPGAELHPAFAHLLLGDGFEGHARDFIAGTATEDRHYVAMMLWWRLVQAGRRGEAEKLLSALLPPEQNKGDLDCDKPRSLADAELQKEGDLTPWREHLLCSLRNDQRIVFTRQDYAKPLYSQSPQTYEFFQCEALFFDALRRSANKHDGYEQTLCHVIEAGCYYSYESVLAEQLLRQSTHVCPALQVDRCNAK